MNKYTIEISCDDSWDKKKLQEQLEMIADFKINKIIKKPKARTNQQNKAIHVYCQLVADECLNKGIDIHTILSKSIEHPVSSDIVKNEMWKKVQESMFNTTSTTKLTSYQVTQVHEVINKYTAEAFEIDIPFPSEIAMRK